MPTALSLADVPRGQRQEAGRHHLAAPRDEHEAAPVVDPLGGAAQPVGEAVAGPGELAASGAPGGDPPVLGRRGDLEVEGQLRGEAVQPPDQALVPLGGEHRKAPPAARRDEEEDRPLDDAEQFEQRHHVLDAAAFSVQTVVLTWRGRPASAAASTPRMVRSNEPAKPRKRSCSAASGASMLKATRRTPASRAFPSGRGWPAPSRSASAPRAGHARSRARRARRCRAASADRRR